MANTKDKRDKAPETSSSPDKPSILITPKERKAFDDIAFHTIVGDPNPGETDYKRKFTDRPASSDETADDLNNQEQAAAGGASASRMGVGTRENKGDSGWKTTVGTAKKHASKPVGAMTIQGRLVQFAKEKGGIPGAILAIVIILLVITVPGLGSLKVPNLMDVINKFRGAASEILTDSTGRQIVLNAISTGFGKRKDGPVKFTDDSDFGKLMSETGDDMRQRFLDNGFEFNQKGDGVEIKWKGRVLGSGNSPAEIGRLFDNAPTEIRIQVGEAFGRSVPVKSWHKRIVANFVKTKYKIPRFGIDEDKDDDSDKNNDDSENGKRERITRQRAKQSYERMLGSFTQAANCLLGFGPCEDEGRKVTDDAKPDGADGDPDNEGRQNAQESVGREVTEVTDELAEQAGRDAAAGRKLSTNLIEKLTEKIIAAAGSKAIPWIGWIDLFATLTVQIERIARGDLIINMAIRLKSEAAGYMFGEWSGYGDQIKDGEMSLDTSGTLADQMGSSSDSVAFNYISGNGRAGKDLDESQKINNVYVDGGLARTAQDVFDTAGMALYSRPDIVAGAYAWYYSIGWLLRKAGDAVGEVAIKAACTEMGIRSWLLNKILPGSPIPDCDKMVVMMTDAIKSMLPHMLALLGLIDPMARDADLFNMLDQGGDVSYAAWGEEQGYRQLTPEQEARQHSRSVAYLDSEFKKLPLHERIFSPTNSKSALAQLAMTTPTLDTSFAGSSMLGFLTKIPSLALTQFSKPALASASTLEASGVPYQNIWGTKQYGATDEDLGVIKAGLPAQFFNGEECPELKDDGSEFNHCVQTKGVADITKASVTGDDGTGGAGAAEEVPEDADKLAPMEELLKPSAGEDCPAGTENRGDHDGFTDGKKVRIRVCEITNFKSTGAESKGQYGMGGATGGLLVNKRIAAVVKKMADQGKNLAAESGFRTMAHQQSLWEEYGSGRAAEPGKSNHQMGLAIDLQTGSIPWFVKNARGYGFKQNSTDCPRGWEKWHWSPTGC